MRRFIFTVLLLLLPLHAFSLDAPQLKGRVNDYAGLLTPATVQELERRLAELERTDSTQIVVLTVPSLGGDDIESFSIKVAEAWRIGQKGIANGVILVIARDERRVRIEVGRGLEGVLTDLVSGRIRNEMAQWLTKGDFDRGVLVGIEMIKAVVKGEYKADKSGKRDLRKGNRGFHPSITLVIFLAVLCVFLGSISRVLGGVAGAVGLPLMAFFSFAGLSVVVLIALAVVGFLLSLFLSALFGGGSGGGGWWWGGPFGGGGYGGGGGGSDGGFSGGGGDFGGGGASGDW